MIKSIFSIIALLSFQFVLAQTNASKVQLTKGQKIRMMSKDTSNIKQKRGEESMDMKTLSSSMTEVEILEVNDKGYLATATVKKIKVDFDGFGQKMIYDSEDPAKQQGMMADNMKNILDKADTIRLDFDGKKIEDDEKGESKKGKGRGGMMRMMNQGGGNVENAFLLVPAEAKEGNGWKKDASKEDVRTQTIYFVEKITGNLATVSFKRKTKGTVSRSGGQGGDMKIEMDNLSSGLITVDVQTGLVKSYTETTNSNSKTNMMGQEMPSTGVTTTDIVFE
jgi:hypothetical protein